MSVLEPASDQAARIADLWWLYLAVTTGMYVLVLAIAAVAIIVARGARRQDAGPADRAPRLQHALRIMVGSVLSLSLALLILLMLADFRTRRELRSMHQPIVVRVTGHQWWWNFEYPDTVPSRSVTSPNTLHLPLGADVRLDLASHDVIHSLWMPNLAGKRDLVPGHPAQMVVRARRSGTFEGQCAEYCGLQHATMRFIVVVEPPDRFQAWLASQRQIPPPPVSASARRGQQVFLTSTCVMCHTIQGTPAGSGMGPDLTHVGSRPAVAAATLPNVRRHMIGWIQNPQGVRPGVHMPSHPIPDADLAALADYLGGLK